MNSRLKTILSSIIVAYLFAHVAQDIHVFVQPGSATRDKTFFTTKLEVGRRDIDAANNSPSMSIQKMQSNVGDVGVAVAFAGIVLGGIRSMSQRRVNARSSRVACRAGKTLAPMALPCGDVALDYAMMGYRQFVPRLYNFCKTLGMGAGKILPSTGFCSDENQGYATVQILKHFQAFPFNHGYIGGIMALDRHGPHAAHGKDVVIIHAPHVGYDPGLQKYGVYRRKQVEDPSAALSATCGKVAGTLARYQQEYEDALSMISVREEGQSLLVSLSNNLNTDPEIQTEGFFLDFDRLLADGLRNPHMLLSQSKVYVASERFSQAVKAALDAERGDKKKEAEAGEVKKGPGTDFSAANIMALEGDRRAWRSMKDEKLRRLLDPSLFYFKRDSLVANEETRLERICLPYMSKILYGPWEAELMTALIVMQFEFDRAVHSILPDGPYQGKVFLIISGLNIDMGNELGEDVDFPATMFLPWAAMAQLPDGRRHVLEQPELVDALFSQSDENPDAIDIEQSITNLFMTKRKRVTFYDRHSQKDKAAKIL